MQKFIIAALLLIAARPAVAEELTRDQKLIAACYHVDLETVVNSLREGADVNARFGDSETDPFFDGWTGGYFLGSESWTPLIALAQSPLYPQPAAELGKIWQDEDRVQTAQQKIPKPVLDKRRADAAAILQILLSHNCRLDDGDIRGATALFDAVSEEKVEMARELLRYGANPNTNTGIYIDGPGDITPLHEAAGSRELTQMLLEHGANADAKDTKGRTPVDWSEWFNDRDYDLVKTRHGWKTRSRPKSAEPPK